MALSLKLITIIMDTIDVGNRWSALNMVAMVCVLTKEFSALYNVSYYRKPITSVVFNLRCPKSTYSYRLVVA